MPPSHSWLLYFNIEVLDYNILDNVYYIIKICIWHSGFCILFFHLVPLRMIYGSVTVIHGTYDSQVLVKHITPCIFHKCLSFKYVFTSASSITIGLSSLDFVDLELELRTLFLLWTIYAIKNIPILLVNFLVYPSAFLSMLDKSITHEQGIKKEEAKILNNRKSFELSHFFLS